MRPPSITPIVRSDMRDSAGSPTRGGTGPPSKLTLMIPSVDGQSTQRPDEKTERTETIVHFPKMEGNTSGIKQGQIMAIHILHPRWSEMVTKFCVAGGFRYDTTPPLTNSPFKTSS